MATTNLPLTFAQGVIQSTNYVRVGHNTSVHNNDAVWSFVPRHNNVEKLTFTLNWDNEGAGTGWSGAYTYVAIVTTDGSDGRKAATATSYAGKVTKLLKESSGTWTVVFENLTLRKGQRHYIRCNLNGDTYSTMKAFLKAQSDAVEIGSDGSVRLGTNGEWKEGAVYYGVNNEWKESTVYKGINGEWKEGT